MNRLILFLLFVAANASVVAQDEFALGVRTTDPLSPTEEQTRFKLPPGFEIQLVAAEPDINKPLNMAFDATGRLWVTTSIEYPFAAPPDREGRDRLMIFEDFGTDGRARKVTEFADKLNIPNGIYPFRNQDGHWKAIVWSIPNIWLLEDTNGDGKADKREVLYGPFDYSRDTHGNQSSFTRGFDGWLYATHGFNNHSIVTGPDGNTVDMNSGNTYRMRIDGSRIEHHTHGQVNPFGLTWDERGNLYSSDCHSAPIYQLLDGGYYPSFGAPHDGLGFAPVMMEHAHGSTAIDGALYYTDDLWPEEYRDNFFIGNVMTSRLNRDKIVFTGSTPTAVEQADFLTTTDPWFRPVNNVLGPDGALYIADFYNRIIGHYEVPLQHPGRDRERGRIWRVVYKGKPLHPIALSNDLDGLINELGSPNLTRRLLAMGEVTDRFGKKAVDSLESALTALNGSSATSRDSIKKVSLIWTLNRIGQLPTDSVIAFSQDGDPLVRTHILRLLSERGRLVRANLAKPPADGPSAVLKTASSGLSDPDALVRRTAAEVMSAWPLIENVTPLLDALAKADPADTHLVYVLRKALRDQLVDDAVFTEIESLDLISEELRTIAEVAVAVNSGQAGAFLIRNHEHFVDDPEFSSRALQHAARYAPVDSLDELAKAVQELPNADVNFQLNVFRAIQAGIERRGVPFSPTLAQWGGELALELLDSIAGSSDWVNEPVDEFSNPANPWAFQDRVQADTGKPARMLSSLPLGEGLTGRLVSAPFAAPKRLSFYLAGHDGYPDKAVQNRNVIQLRDVESGELITTASPPRNDTAQEVVWDLSAQVGKQVRLEVVDGDTAGAYAWLAFGRIEPAVVSFPTVAPAAVVERQVAATQLVKAAKPVSANPKLGEKLVGLATSPSADVTARAEAWRLTQSVASPLIDVVLDPQVPLVWKTQLMDVIALGDMERSSAFQQRLLNEAPQRVQAVVVNAAVATGDDAMYVVSAMESGQIPASLLNDKTLRANLEKLMGNETRARLNLLVAGLPDADTNLQKMLDQRRRLFDVGQANKINGEQLFTQLCAACHQLGGKGALVGPQLDGIGNRGAERLLEDILDPNRNVDTAFRTSTFVLKNGEVESGLFRREDGALIVIANAAGQEFTVNKSEVTERHESANSLMPSNFSEALTQEQFNNLLAFLLGQR